MKLLYPGATLGVLGGGQLGLMFANSARAMGYQCAVWDPSNDSPAGRVADVHVKQPFEDDAAYKQFVSKCDAVTLEFENVPLELVECLEDDRMLVTPSAYALDIAQNRIKEKNFIKGVGVAVTPFHPIWLPADLDDAFERLSSPIVLKTAQFGYDGKGQRVVDTAEQASLAFDEMKQVPCIAESRLPLAAEISVVLARTEDGTCEFFPPSENVHRDGILHLSKVPATVSKEIQTQARMSAQRIADSLEYQGVLAVEFFVVGDGKDKQEELYVNEIAPRPHNTGHYTIDACTNSQFDQQVRMMCGMSAAATQLLRPVVMVNLLGDLWQRGEPRWESLLKDPLLKLHLYGKKAPRRGRKMGHFCLLGEEHNSNVDALQTRAEQYHQALAEGWLC